MDHLETPGILDVLSSPLGWIALVGVGDSLERLTFGHRSAEAAVRALDARLLRSVRRGTWDAQLAAELWAFASGTPVDFSHVVINSERLTEFQRRVVHQCRQIPYGRTVTYGQLAAAAGSPRAARAVGNCMAANRFPLIVPCHRVVSASGYPGPFSAPGGTRMKLRLLQLETGRGG